MSKHTPGPWHVVEHSWSRTGIYSEGGVCIAALDISDEANEDTQAVWEGAMATNARLIAAAPDLLEALRLQVSAFDGDALDEIEEGYGLATAQRVDAARAAIAKATEAA